MPVEFPGSVPEDADAWKEEMQAGIRDVCSLEEPYAGRLLDAAVGMKAKEQPEWEEVCCRIRGGEQVNEPLKYARGRAFTVLCPIGPQTDGDRPSAALLEKDLGVLAASGYSDRLLGETAAELSAGRTGARAEKFPDSLCGDCVESAGWGQDLGRDLCLCGNETVSEMGSGDPRQGIRKNGVRHTDPDSCHEPVFAAYGIPS